MDIIKRSIDFPKELMTDIETLCTLEERSFGGQVRVLLKEALNSRTVQDKINNFTDYR